MRRVYWKQTFLDRKERVIAKEDSRVVRGSTSETPFKKIENSGAIIATPFITTPGPMIRSLSEEEDSQQSDDSEGSSSEDDEEGEEEDEDGDEESASGEDDDDGEDSAEEEKGKKKEVKKEDSVAKLTDLIQGFNPQEMKRAMQMMAQRAAKF